LQEQEFQQPFNKNKKKEKNSDYNNHINDNKNENNKNNHKNEKKFNPFVLSEQSITYCSKSLPWMSYFWTHEGIQISSPQDNHYASFYFFVDWVQTSIFEAKRSIFLCVYRTKSECWRKSKFPRKQKRNTQLDLKILFYKKI